MNRRGFFGLIGAAIAAPKAAEVGIPAGSRIQVSIKGTLENGFAHGMCWPKYGPWGVLVWDDQQRKILDEWAAKYGGKANAF